MGLFNERHPQAGFTAETADLLCDPVTRLEAIATICETYLGDIDRQALFSRIGLSATPQPVAC
ncbi:hypothetical protein ACPCTK_13370 [Streptomyces pseudogriseolus]|uniref:hypothetical protein n=1 Tax=Streptomyces pseudogriseolus TaxID=36817 RepID=UPI003FA2E898